MLHRIHQDYIEDNVGNRKWQEETKVTRSEHACNRLKTGQREISEKWNCPNLLRVCVKKVLYMYSLKKNQWYRLPHFWGSSKLSKSHGKNSRFHSRLFFFFERKPHIYTTYILYEKAMHYFLQAVQNIWQLRIEGLKVSLTLPFEQIRNLIVLRIQHSRNILAGNSKSCRCDEATPSNTSQNLPFKSCLSQALTLHLAETSMLIIW